MYWHTFHTTDDAAQALARAVAAELAKRLETQERVTVAMPGGRSPVAFFEALSCETLDWSRVTVTLVDDRLVDEGHEDSNAGLVRRHLLQNKAAAATFWPLVTEPSNPKADIARLDAELPEIDLVVFGMGEDGHAGSLFPDAPETDEGLAENNPHAAIIVTPPNAPHQRITLTLARLLTAEKLYLAIQGRAKAKIVQASGWALTGRWPISYFVQQAKAPLEVYWAP
ncbi:6-phosphogluconolactonase [Crenobacter cavernae]|uniref:6-phosphogluconolactonase n=1 Tax=Crenobacter cavernae TaxID=2290923 RepID=A0A345Y4E5_9NEIS|nr:6-phosphogluconolactonase [Crenobacter cavernae]AXK38797.1 6-phosphogluconolactonase [Crenobacter cavernae]